MKTRSQSRLKGHSSLLLKPPSTEVTPQEELHLKKPDQALIGKQYPKTPDGRYFVVKGRLWRCSNPTLSEDVRQELVNKLMVARRNVGVYGRRSDPDKVQMTRASVHEAKVALGERGPVWWRDGAKDYNRYMVKNTSYQEWYQSLSGSAD
eukprot:Awhi_evm1s1945